MLAVSCPLPTAEPRHAPVVGFVRHTLANSDDSTDCEKDLSSTFIVSALPTLDVATASTPVPAFPWPLAMPSPVSVAASATMSATDVAAPDSSSVLRPLTLGAGSVFVQSKTSAMSVAANATRGVIAKTKLWLPPGAMLTAMLAVPVTWLVVGFVVWKLSVAWTPWGKGFGNEIVQPVAVVVPVLMIVAKAVAAVPIFTDRLAGRTDARSGEAADAGQPRTRLAATAATTPVTWRGIRLVFTRRT